MKASSFATAEVYFGELRKHSKTRDLHTHTHNEVDGHTVDTFRVIRTHARAWYRAGALGPPSNCHLFDFEFPVFFAAASGRPGSL